MVMEKIAKLFPTYLMNPANRKTFHPRNFCRLQYKVNSTSFHYDTSSWSCAGKDILSKMNSQQWVAQPEPTQYMPITTRAVSYLCVAIVSYSLSQPFSILMYVLHTQNVRENLVFFIVFLLRACGLWKNFSTDLINECGYPHLLSDFAYCISLHDT